MCSSHRALARTDAIGIVNNWRQKSKPFPSKNKQLDKSYQGTGQTIKGKSMPAIAYQSFVKICQFETKTLKNSCKYLHTTASAL